MVLENSTIIIGLAVAIIWFGVYRKSKLIGSISMIGTGLLTLWYSSALVDPKAYGVLGLIVFIFGLIMIIDWLTAPVKSKRKS